MMEDEQQQRKRGGWNNPASAGNGKAGGRPATKVTFRRGERLIIHRARVGEVAREEIGAVLSVSADELEVQIGEEILVLRRPDPEEIA